MGGPSFVNGISDSYTEFKEFNCYDRLCWFPEINAFIQMITKINGFLNA